MDWIISSGMCRLAANLLACVSWRGPNAAPHSKAGAVIRALAWLGPEKVEYALDAVEPELAADELDELAAARAVMPYWMAESVSSRLS